MRIEHSDLAGIPRAYVKRLIIRVAGASLEMKQLEDPVSGLYARFAVALAERVAEFDAGDADAFVQVLYETAVQRMCDELDLPLDTVPNLVEQA